MSIRNRKHVIVGLSGGVDSAVAALILLKQGFQVEALFMKNWEEDDEYGYCAAAQDLDDARGVCDRLGIHLHTVNFADEYWHRVFEHFLAEYRAGRTPNPDVMCNKEIKFKAFLEFALGLGADVIATGHYAGIGKVGCKFSLHAGLDRDKDQSYFLHTLGQRELAHTLFPLGKLSKLQVRRIAHDFGLANHAKKDSTGICFIGERRFRDFLARYLPAQCGEIVTVEGDTIGTHQGIMFYTIGQRQGLGIGGHRYSSELPWFVVDKDVNGNRLIVAQGHDHPALHHYGLVAEQLHWVMGKSPALPFRCLAKIRYRQHAQACRLEAVSKARILVTFDRSQRAITPGQSVVFYRDDRCLGGGIINERLLGDP